ncbi:MAG TPA: hypothetical protein VLA22_01370 [Gaiellaceae bacterium]|nr:hypothetical protein [Gaiellaceae bacterium]
MVESKSEEGERLIALPTPLVEELADHYAASVTGSASTSQMRSPRPGSRGTFAFTTFGTRL